MRSYSAGELSRAVSGLITGDTDFKFSFISIDSRTIPFSSGSVFFALSGKVRDGHDYIEELMYKGVKCFVVSGNYSPSIILPEVTLIRVKDTLQALQDFAAFIRSEYKGTLIGITGSNGKTIVKEWIYQVLRNIYPIYRSPRSYNSQVGVPLSLSLLENVYSISVIEAGISFPGEMANLQKMINPDIGIFTNIGEAHQENFSGYREKLEEKLMLFRKCKQLIYCCDNDLIHETVRKKLSSEVKLISWGFSAKSDYKIERITKKDNKTSLKIFEINKEFVIPFTDDASIENAMHVLVFCLSFNVPVEILTESLPKLEAVEMRLEILRGFNSCTIISDSYNSDIRSVQNSLDLLMQQNHHSKKTVILSDIFQSGKTEFELYTDIAELIRSGNIDLFIGIGQGIGANRYLFNKESLFYSDTESFIRSGVWSTFRNQAILVKGSRLFEFERITHLLQEKSHQTILEINLTSLVSNYNAYRSLLGPGTRIMAMVKAFSYGSGSFEIANKMQFLKADYLAVAFADEGVELRKNGINLPVMVMNPDPLSFWTIVEHKLEPEIYSPGILEAFIRFADRNGLVRYPVHIKLDTGMHRLGFDRNDMPALLKQIPSPFFDVISVFSHLAAADEHIHDDFSREQINCFKMMCEEIRSINGKGFLMHLLNSAGIVRFPEASFDMVRLGIGLYGIEIVDKPGLKEVSTFKTHISQIRIVNKGETIGYNRKGKADELVRIATVPVGYADGIPRKLGNGAGKFLVNGHLAPIIGNVCMDMCMLDITGIEAGEGDEVIIFGPGHSVNILAKAAETIPYEILTGIPERVKRVYLEE